MRQRKEGHKNLKRLSFQFSYPTFVRSLISTSFIHSFNNSTYSCRGPTTCRALDTRRHQRLFHLHWGLAAERQKKKTVKSHLKHKCTGNMRTFYSKGRPIFVPFSCWSGCSEPSLGPVFSHNTPILTQEKAFTQ